MFNNTWSTADRIYYMLAVRGASLNAKHAVKQNVAATTRDFYKNIHYLRRHDGLVIDKSKDGWYSVQASAPCGLKSA